jgi:hypothetical protein
MINHDDCRCSKEAELAKLSAEMVDLRRRCALSEAAVTDIKDDRLPRAIKDLVDTAIVPASKRLRFVEGWIKYAIGYAGGFAVLAVFIANKLWGNK